LHPRAPCARATKTAILTRTAELHEGDRRTLRAFRLATWRNVFRSGLLRCLVAHVHAGPRRLIANSKNPRIPHAGACPRARARATDGEVRCGGCGLVLCVQHGVSGATLRTTWASDAMVVFTAREGKFPTPKQIARLA
jgi:hypothetical protein